MLSALIAIVDFITQTVQSIVHFFGLLGDGIVTVTRYVIYMPPWLSGLFLSVFMILFVRLIIGR